MSYQITIRKAPDDPVCTRVSLGGTAKEGFYCTYRGTAENAIEVLRHTLFAMEKMKDSGIEPPITPMNPIGAPGRS